MDTGVRNDNSSAQTSQSTDSASSSDSGSETDEELEKSKRKEKQRKAKRSGVEDENLIVFTKEQLDEYMNKSIGSAVENAMKSFEQRKSAETQSELNNMLTGPLSSLTFEQDDHVRNSDSDRTIYSQLIKPPQERSAGPVVTFRSPLLSPEKDTLRTKTPEEDLTADELNKLSDDSNLDSSGELMSTSDIAGPVLPPPPPGAPIPLKDPASELIDERTRTRQRADQLLRNAEINKATMAKPPGKSTYIPPEQLFYQRAMLETEVSENLDGSLDYMHDTVSDHVNRLTVEKITRGEYVDFVKLLPRDLDSMTEDDNLQLTSREGKTYYVAPLDKDPQQINSYRKWQLAFRVFQAIYIARFPEKSLELLQYAQLIEDYCSTWIWDNVYRYDKRHRRIMERFKNRFWHVPYDFGKKELKITHTMNSGRQGSNFKPNQNTQSGSAKRVACKNFNHGHCKFGDSCKFDHNRCSNCNKPGHLIGTCRKLKIDKPTEKPGEVDQLNK